MAEVSAIDKALEAVSTQIAADCEGGDLPPSAYTSTAKRALTAALSALESEGWVLVPLEPTEAMIYQGHHEIDWNRNGQNTSVPRHGSQKEPIDGELVGTFCEDDIRDSYRAMLASRPAPTAPASED